MPPGLPTHDEDSSRCRAPGSAARLLFLASLALLPWGGLTRLPWLHRNAQWGDLLVALAAAAWVADRAIAGRLTRPRAVQVLLGLYLGWAALSLLAASPRAASGPAKLLGLGMLLALFVLTSDLLARPGTPQAVGRVLAATSLLTAAAAVAGVALFALGLATSLVGGWGDLAPGPLARVRAGAPHPNLLASWCVFASGFVAREDSGLSRAWRRAVQAALAVTVVLTGSRAVLAFLLAAAIRRATTPARRRQAGALAAALLVAMAGLTLFHVEANPLRPWEARRLGSPSPRREAVATSLETLRERPLLGTGPGGSPGRHDGRPFDAHLTPLNVAATLGLPALAFLALAVAALWRERARPTDLATWGLLGGLALDGLGQDVEDFRHVWVALGLADAGRRAPAGTGGGPTGSPPSRSGATPAGDGRS